MKTSILGLALVAALAATVPGTAKANHVLQQTPSGTCNGALPGFEQSLRFRPLALANQGTTNAFVSCTQLNRFNNPVYWVYIAFENTGTADATISCSLVTGRDSFAKSTYPKSITVSAGSSDELSWEYSSDNLGTPFLDLSNLSCNLPAGTELELIEVETYEDGI